jgi:hypothetical protein
MVNLRAREAERAAQMFAAKKGLDESKADERFFEASTSTNKEVANILDTQATNETLESKQPAKVKLDEAAWGEEDDLDIDDEIMGGDANTNVDVDSSMPGDNDIFVPASPGADPLLAVLRQNP